MDYRVKTNELDVEIAVKKTTDNIVDKLVQFRKNQGLTQQNIADATGIHRANIARIEGKKNVVSLDSLTKYASCVHAELSVELKEKNTIKERSGERFSTRTEMLLGQEAVNKLKKTRVAVFGVGGVGGYVVEALARSGVGAIDVIDNDTVSVTNINRQLIALQSTVGQYKVDVIAERIKDINPEAVVHVHRVFYLPETAAEFDFTQYDYVVDAIDTVSGKLMLVEQAHAAGVPIISAMGAGNKLDPTAFRVADIYDTKVCPLAKVMRRELKKRGIDKLKVVYSEEEAMTPAIVPGATGEIEDDGSRKKAAPGSVAFVPSVMGLIMAGEVIKDLSVR